MTRQENGFKHNSGVPSAHWYLFPLILFSESKGASTVEREREPLMKSKEDRWRRYWISSSHPSLLGANSERDAFPPQSVWERVRENEKRLVDQPYNLRGSVERALQAGRGKHPPLLDQSLSRRFQFSLAEQPTWAITYHFGDDHCLFSQTFLSICLKSESCMMKKEETRNIFCHSASNISKISLSL